MSESLEKTKKPARSGVRKTVRSESKKRESKKIKAKISKSQSNESKNSRILFLAISEREKSLKFYESLCGFNGVDSDNLANLQNENLQNVLDENLRAIFMRIAKKERDILANARAILQKINADSSVDSADSNADSSVDSNTDSHKSNKSILLPSALPDDILGALLNEMGDLAHLNILALGVESHHLKTCDFLIKTAQQTQQTATNAQIIDILYQLQALSYNHHIPLLNGESTKENANPNSENLSNPSTIPPLLSDLLKQSPLLNEFKSAFDSLQNIYAQTKIIVQKLERGELSQDELVNFLQKL